MDNPQRPWAIKLVRIRDKDSKKVEGGGGENFKTFLPPDKLPGHRTHLQARAVAVAREFSAHFRGPRSDVPAVARVSLAQKALAKTHRPLSLFNHTTCPVIGTGRFGELYVAVTPRGLDSLATRIDTANTPRAEANLTAVVDIQPFSARDNTQQVSESQSERALIRVFDYLDSATDRRARRYVQDIAESLGLQPEWVRAGDRYEVLRVLSGRRESLEQLGDFVAVRRIVPERSIRVISRVLRPLSRSEGDLPKPLSDVEYPIVGMFDSGIPQDHHLASWVIAREQFVAPQETNHEHGSFVGGILVFGGSLDDFGHISQDRAAKLVDICMLPNSDEKFGRQGVLKVPEANQIIEQSIRKYRSLGIRVWNISFNADELCEEDAFSEFALALDSLQDEFDVVIVVSAGNYDSKPLRPWPPADNLQLNDRIALPADSVRAITVGAVSRRSNDVSLAPENSPAPFSRRGPGPAFLFKPELVDYGGNCDENGDFSGLGERSFSATGGLVEDVGTSYSAPRIANLMARIDHACNGKLSTNLLKALAIHAARHPATGRGPSADDAPYVGFGRPSDLSEILAWPDEAFTFVVEESISPGYEIDILDFPYPSTLIANGRYYGSISATLVYDPPLDPRGGSMYIRHNLTFTMGTYRLVPDEDGKVTPKYTRQVHPVPRFGGGRYERELIEEGWKWAPIKTYHRRLTKGIATDPWRIKLELQKRDELVPYQSQSFALVITMSGSVGTDVNSATVRALRQSFALQNMELRDRIRTRLGIRSEV